MRLQLVSILALLIFQKCNAFIPNQYRFRPFTPQSIFVREATVTRLPDSAVEIAIEVPGAATKAAYDKVCSELSKNIQIPGFRKGSRIPPEVLEQRMSARGGRNALKVQAINELLAQLVESALKEESLEPIGQPSLKISAEELADNYIPGEDLILPVKCDIWPEIKWDTSKGDKPYVGITGKYTRKPFNKEKLEKALNDLQERYATTDPVADQDHTLQIGDACHVNMVGYMATEAGEKGDPLPNAASGDNVEVVLGYGRYMEGLVEGLVGAKVGESRQVSVSFPNKLRDKSLAGKKAIFDVEILRASKRVVPEVTDEFAAQVRAGLTADSLMAELRKAVDQEDSKEYAGARNKAISEGLAKVMDVEVPDTLVTNQAREKFAAMMADMRANGVSDDEIKKQITPENFNKYKEIIKDDIVRDFKVSMATDEIARLEGISVPDYQIEEQMEAIRKDAAENNEEFDDAKIRPKVTATLTRNAVMDWLAEQSNLDVEYKEEEAFDEKLMQKIAEETAERELQMSAEVQATPVALSEKVDEADTHAGSTFEAVATVEPAASKQPETELVAVEPTSAAKPATPETDSVGVEEPEPEPLEDPASAEASVVTEVSAKKLDAEPVTAEPAAAINVGILETESVVVAETESVVVAETEILEEQPTVGDSVWTEESTASKQAEPEPKPNTVERATAAANVPIPETESVGVEELEASKEPAAVEASDMIAESAEVSTEEADAAASTITEAGLDEQNESRLTEEADVDSSTSTETEQVEQNESELASVVMAGSTKVDVIEDASEGRPDTDIAAPESDEDKADRYGNMDANDRAFEILKDLGL